MIEIESTFIYVVPQSTNTRYSVMCKVYTGYHCESMVCVPVRSIIPLLKLGDYLFVQAHKPCSISHLFQGHWKESVIPTDNLRHEHVILNLKYLDLYENKSFLRFSMADFCFVKCTYPGVMLSVFSEYQS